MFKKISISSLFTQGKVAFFRFPIALSLAYMTAILSLWMVEIEPEFNNFMLKGVVMGTLSFFFFLVLTLFSENLTKDKRSGVMLLGVLFLIFYYFDLPQNLKEEPSNMFFLRHFFLTLACLVGLFWMAFGLGSVTNKIIWEWNRRLLGNLIITSFLSLVLFLGTILALFSIEKLFSFDVEAKRYFQIWVCVVGFFAPLFFLSQLPKKALSLKIPSRIPAFMSVLTKYILTPLSLVYFLILYAYTFKIILTGDVPQGILGWLVIGFLTISMITYLLWTPFVLDKWQKYRRIFWYLFLPQVGILFFAIWVRISAYGWTQNRYFVVLFGVWILGVSIYFLFYRKAKFKAVFMALSLLIFLSQYGFWSAYSVGTISQKNRLERMLIENNILVSGVVVPLKNSEDLDRKIRFEIGDIVRYFVKNNEYQGLEKVLPGISKQKEIQEASPYQKTHEITKWLGFEFISKWDLRRNDREGMGYFSMNLNPINPIDINGYDWKFAMRYGKKSELPIASDKFVAFTDYAKQKITLQSKKAVFAEIDLKPFFENLLETKAQSSDMNLVLSPQDAQYLYTSDRLEAKIVFSRISGRNKKVERFSGDIYFRVLDLKK